MVIQQQQQQINALGFELAANKDAIANQSSNLDQLIDRVEFIMDALHASMWLSMPNFAPPRIPIRNVGANYLGLTIWVLTIWVL